MSDNTAAGKAETKSKQKPFRQWDLLCVGLLFVITLLAFSSFVFSDKILGDAYSDQLSAVGNRHFLAGSIVQHGQLPTWDSGRLAGMPSVDAIFGDVFYPVSAVFRPFVPAPRLFGLLMVVHVFLAGAFFFLMLRRSFCVSRPVAFAGALFYMLSPQFVSHVYPGHDGKMFVIAWLPFVVWRLRTLLCLPSLRNACLMAAGIAMMVLTSHIQMTYFVLMGIFLYWATDVARTVIGKGEKKLVTGKALFFWIGVFVGLGIACIQMYPSYMFIREAFSVRGVDRGFDFAASWSMNWAEFFSLWVHEFGNSLDYYWGKNYFKLNTEYAGAVPLLLSALAFASKPKSVWRVFWAAIAVLAAIYALGANTPFFKIFYHAIPGVKRFRAPSMIMFWFTFGTALMAAFFIKDLLCGRFDGIKEHEKKKWNIGLPAALGAVTLIAIIFSIDSIAAKFAGSMMGGGNASQVFKVNYKEKFVPNLWFWWLMCAVALGMLIAVINGKLKPVTLFCALIIMGAIDTAKVNSQFIKADSRWKYFYRDDAALKELGREMGKAPFRVLSLPNTFTTRNQEALYGLESVNGFHDNELNCYRAFRGDQGDVNYLADIAEIAPGGGMRLSMARIAGNTPFLDLAGVDYVLGAGGSGGIIKVKNPTSLGRLSYVPDFVVMPEDEIISALRTGRHDYRAAAALLEKPELPWESGYNSRTGDAGEQFKVEWKKYTPNVRVAAVSMPDNGFLRISEVYYPGWEIRVDGKQAKYYRSDMAWMAVPLKAGKYEVTMKPKSLYLGDAVMVSLIFAVFTGVVLILTVPRKRPSPQA